MTARAPPQLVEPFPPSIVPANRQLACLPPHDLARLVPHLERTVLRKGRVLHEPGDLVSYVFLPERGTLIGLFMPLMKDHAVEIATVDRTGALSMVEAVEDGRALARATVVLPGPALRMPARAFAAAARQSGPVRGMVRRTARMMLAEMAHNAACHAAHNAEQRIARWLLAAHDLVRDGTRPEADADVDLPVTQEQLGDMLGLQRTTVTIIARRLQSAAAVSYTRGHLRVCDRAALSMFACDCNAMIARAHCKLTE